MYVNCIYETCSTYKQTPRSVAPAAVSAVTLTPWTVVASLGMDMFSNADGTVEKEGGNAIEFT